MNSHQLSLSEIRERYPHAENLGEVLDFIQRDLCDADEVVCGFTVNGMEFDESDEGRLKSCQVEEIQSISVRSSTVAALVGESLKTGTEYVRYLQRSTETLSSEFRSGDRKKAFEELRVVSEGLQTVFDLMRYVQRLGHLEAENGAQTEAQFLKLMSTLIPAVEKRDFIFVADLLEYEVSSLLASIGGIFSKQIGDGELHGIQDPSAGNTL